jgi:hypothetical protein
MNLIDRFRLCPFKIDSMRHFLVFMMERPVQEAKFMFFSPHSETNTCGKIALHPLKKASFRPRFKPVLPPRYVVSSAPICGKLFSRNIYKLLFYKAF